jgi:DNA-binding response OmpR family regulator
MMPLADPRFLMRVLIVEDEKKVAALIGAGLMEQGFIAELCHNGDEGLRLAGAKSYDAIVLDVMLPGRDGLSILRHLREARNSVPVLLLTARGDVNERIEGLNLGADDYLAKPFSVEELVARLRSIWRRSAGDGLSLLTCADLSLNLHTREAKRSDRTIELTSREFTLLETLLRAPGRVLTRTQICAQVWHYQFDPGTNIVDVAVQRLRRKIDDDHPLKLLQTVRGVGYTLKEPS